MEESLDNKILKWINKGGFPLELKAIKILKNIGYSIGQSINYLDSQTNNPREIDIMAYKYYKLNNTWLTITLTIECKYSPDKPWIGFSSIDNRFDIKDTIVHRFSNKVGKDYLNELVNDDLVKSLLLFKTEDLRCFNVTRAFSDNLDMAYSATTSVINATQAFVNKANKLKRIIRIFFPIVLVDGLIYNCFLNEQDEIEIKKEGMLKLITTNSFESKSFNFIDIISLDMFESIAKQYYNEFEIIYNKIKEIRDIEEQFISDIYDE